MGELYAIYTRDVPNPNIGICSPLFILMVGILKLVIFVYFFWIQNFKNLYLDFYQFKWIFVYNLDSFNVFQVFFKFFSQN